MKWLRLILYRFGVWRVEKAMDILIYLRYPKETKERRKELKEWHRQNSGIKSQWDKKGDK